MEQITVFKAFDGRQFNTGAECLEYERNSLPQHEAMMNILLFDEKVNLIPFKPGMTYSWLYDKMQFFVIVKKTEESLDCLYNILDQGSYNYPAPIEEGRIYTWSNRDGWFDYSEKFCKMKETVDIIIDSIDLAKKLRSQIKENT